MTSAAKAAWHQQKTMPVLPKHRIQLIAHRGASGYAPENTLSAFTKAVELGADGIEFDVQRTVDGHLVVIHDEVIDRVTNGQGMLRQKTLAELQPLDAGSWFGADFAGEKIPTLRAFFDFMQGNDLIMHIEVKDPFYYAGIAQQLVDMIREYNFVERAQVRSFSHDVLHEVFQLAPDIAISELWFHKMPDEDETYFRTLNMDHRLLSQAAIEQIHARGQKVTAWTVNEVEVATQLIAWGIDGLTGNYPDRFLDLV